VITSSLVLVYLVSYGVGAIPFAVLVGRWTRGVDVQRSGSGNAGALNTFRTVGRGAGVAVALLDAAKAALAMLLGRIVGGPELAALSGAIAVAGHCFSPWLLWTTRHDRGDGWKWQLRRSGGKGLASGMGALLLIDWWLAAIALLIFGASFAVLRKDVTWPTIIAVGCTPAAVWLLTADPAITLAVLIVSLVVIVKHLPDVREGFYVT
jgi:acyl phosphate:glycerol-3-phosphate acyltransferase